MKKEKNSQITKKVVSYILVFIIMLIVFCVSMIVSYALPNEKIQGHIKESKDLILKSNGNPLFGSYVEGAKMDEFTDLLILNTAMNKGKQENEGLLTRAFENSRFSEENGNQFLSLEQTLEQQDLKNNEEYSRYWHGIQSILRPLLLFLNYEEIRFLFMIFIYTLLVLAVISISRNLNIMHGLAFLFSMMSICFFIIPASLQYIGVFAIMLIGVNLVNLLYKKNKEKLYPYLFFIIGGCATFFDLLTAPLITLGIPLIMVILLRNKKEEINLKKAIVEIIKLSILWCIAYAGIFFAKWVIASIILQRDAITVAINNILFRVNGNEEYPITRFGAIKENIRYLYNTVLVSIIAIITISWIVIFIKNKKKVKDLKVIIPLILVVLYPYIWYFVFAGHSTIHAYFTYRVQAIAIFGILSAMIESINIKELKKK